MNNDQKIADLINELNEFVSNAERATKSLESPHAEFVETIGYGDAPIDLSEIDDVVVYSHMDYASRAELLEILEAHATVEVRKLHTPRVDGEAEILSYALGEEEVEVPDEIRDELKKLNSAEFAKVQMGVIGGILDRDATWMYIDCSGTRFVLVLDVDGVRETMSHEAVEA
jgi:hypothetical protein